MGCRVFRIYSRRGRGHTLTPEAGGFTRRSCEMAIKSPARQARSGRLKDLVRISDLGRRDLMTLLDAARGFKVAPLSKSDLLAGETVVLYFNKPSTRTRISFETAIARLGGTPVSVGAHELQLDRGESIEDTARVISAYASAFVVRTFRDADVRRFAAASTIPVINALTDGHHPCQALADLLTMEELWGDVRGRHVAFIGDGDNVANSLIEACALLGVNITLATPPGYEPEAELVAAAQEVGYAGGCRIHLTSDPAEAVHNADAVYTDVWTSMGVPDAELQRRMQDFEPYRVDTELMSLARSDAVFMHCLPAHRGDEVTDEVIDGPRSRVFEQAANRLPTEQALLWALVTGALER
jgi:ornithine carbamoyltransferase